MLQQGRRNRPGFIFEQCAFRQVKKFGNPFSFSTSSMPCCGHFLLSKVTGSIHICLLGLPQIIFEMRISRSKIKPEIAPVMPGTENESVESESQSCVELTKCHRCFEMVSPFELPEHLDYHLAQDISKQMRQETGHERQQPSSSSRKVARTQTGKRKKGNSVEQPDPKKQRDISAFFTKKL